LVRGKGTNPTIQEVVEYRGPSLKSHIAEVYALMGKYHIAEVYALMGKYHQYWRGDAHGIPVEAPRVGKDECIFWETYWLKEGISTPGSSGGGAFSGTQFAAKDVVLELNDYKKRFEQLILGADGDTYAPDMFPEGGVKNQVEFTEVSVDDIIDSPEAIEVILSDQRVRKYIDELLSEQHYNFLDYALFSAVHSQHKGGPFSSVEKLRDNYNGDNGVPTILYVYEVQGFDGKQSSDRVSVLFDAVDKKILRSEHEGKIKRSFGT